ncbi:MAG: R3H domain-containing nucleic acid-binding protein, partial [Dehalococcoidales bacterium]
EVIVIDEIGTELEARAARTIAERGVQLVGTAHGNTLENLMMNPTLADLVGGIQSVTLGDEEARRRRTQKSILERMAPPTFSIVVEIQERDRVAIHSEVSEAVDAILRGLPAETETRWLDADGEVKVEKPVTARKKAKESPPAEVNRQRLYIFGVNRARLEQAAKEMNLSLDIVSSLKEADLFVTSKNYYQRKPQKVRDAETANLPVYVLKSNTPPQLRQFLHNIYPAVSPDKEDYFRTALGEAEVAVAQVKEGGVVELSPQSAYIRRLQHLIAERNALSSQSVGRGTERRVTIYKG